MDSEEYAENVMKCLHTSREREGEGEGRLCWSDCYLARLVDRTTWQEGDMTGNEALKQKSCEHSGGHIGEGRWPTGMHRKSQQAIAS